LLPGPLLGTRPTVICLAVVTTPASCAVDLPCEAGLPRRAPPEERGRDYP